VESKIIFSSWTSSSAAREKQLQDQGRNHRHRKQLIKKVILSALVDLEKAWQPLVDLKVAYQRSEINPQFVQLVPPTDVVVVSNFEIEVEYSSGTFSLCIPYSTLGPLRDRLQAGYQSEQMEVDKTWLNRFKGGLFNSKVDLTACWAARRSTPARGQSEKGDVIPLDRFSTDPIDIFVEGVMKFRGHPVIYKGNQAIKISDIITRDEVADYGIE
jgi:flagellar motor switch protein FliM